MRIITCKVKFNDLYRWTEGWSGMAVKRRWHKFWREVFPTKRYSFWTFHTDEDVEYLVENGGAIYLHPMDFTVAIRKIGTSGTYVNGRFVETFMEIDTLRKICDDLIAYIGIGSVEFGKVKSHELEV